MMFNAWISLIHLHPIDFYAKVFDLWVLANKGTFTHVGFWPNRVAFAWSDVKYTTSQTDHKKMKPPQTKTTVADRWQLNMWWEFLKHLATSSDSRPWQRSGPKLSDWNWSWFLLATASIAKSQQSTVVQMRQLIHWVWTCLNHASPSLFHHFHPILGCLLKDLLRQCQCDAASGCTSSIGIGTLIGNKPGTLGPWSPLALWLRAYDSNYPKYIQNHSQSMNPGQVLFKMKMSDVRHREELIPWRKLQETRSHHTVNWIRSLYPSCVESFFLKHAHLLIVIIMHLTGVSYQNLTWSANDDSCTFCDCNMVSLIHAWPWVWFSSRSGWYLESLFRTDFLVASTVPQCHV